MTYLRKFPITTLILGAVLCFSVSSCLKRIGCRKIDCENGECIMGDCECEYGYTKNAEGVCHDETRAGFIGTWRGTHTINQGPSSAPYNITITAADWDKLYITVENLMNLECNALGAPLRNNAKVMFPNYSNFDNHACTEPETSGGSIDLLDPNTISIRLFLSNTTTNEDGSYAGVYVKQ